MNAYEFGRYVFENHGLAGVARAVGASPGLSSALSIATGAASYYNPYIAAASTVPVIYEGTKWLVDKVF